MAGAVRPKAEEPEPIPTGRPADAEPARGRLGALARFSPDPLLRFLIGLFSRLARIRPRAPLILIARVVRWYSALIFRELAWHLAAIGLLLLAPLRALGAGARRSGRALIGLIGVGAAVELRRALLAHRSRGVVEQALDGVEGDGAPATPPTNGAARTPLSHFLVPPLMFVARDVERQRGIVYSEAEGRRLRLDIYRPPSGPGADRSSRRPALIEIHGGGWFSGSRFEQGIPLLNHLARCGWVGINIDYRLAPEHPWPAQIVDVKRAIAWVRKNAAELGIDPERIAITGGSAGGHLCALAGLTANDPGYQPGFEDADTSVRAAVPFYGIYDLTDEGQHHYYPELRSWVHEQILFQRRFVDDPETYRRASPAHRIHAGAPPFLVVHGSRDTLVPVGDAREFVERLHEVSTSAVHYIELEGAEHAFDLWPSPRSVAVAEGVRRFLDAVTVGERVPA